MTINDIIKAIARTLSTKINTEIYIEWEDTAERPSLYISCIDYKKTYAGKNKELLNASFDILYLPTSANESRNIEILEKFEEINNCFDHYGKKYIKILDRAAYIDSVSTRIVDNKGHYIFDLSFYVEYGEQQTYELMQDLKLRLKEENKYE